MRHVRVYVNMELRIQVTKYKLQNTSYVYNKHLSVSTPT